VRICNAGSAYHLPTAAVISTHDAGNCGQPGDPCEVVRELISNASDANATEVLVLPYIERKGLVFFDNGVGLSQAEKDMKNGVVPYVAFFSIGKTTKVRGQGIGYKCQGSKLCFASSRVTVLTRCAGEADWRWLRVEDPKNSLHEGYDITPKTTNEPWALLENTVFSDPDDRTLGLLKHVNREFFEKVFTTGTLVIVEGFDVPDYNKYFSVESPAKSYLYNYIRYNTSHGDVRRIQFDDSGFTNVDMNVVTSNVKAKAANLRLLMDPGEGTWNLVSIPAGYRYLTVTADDEKVASPNEVSRLRDGRFCGRYATVIDHGGRKYSLILAIDAKRRALDGYKELGRQKNIGCGISLSTQRGTFLAAHGIKICHYDQLFEADALGDFEVLRDNTENHLFFIDGPFELVTNRNAPAPNALQLLADKTFLEKVKLFLEDIVNKRPRGAILRELVERLAAERTHQREDHYHKIMAQVKESLPARGQFRVIDVPQLKDRWFFEPGQGEENFVGALFTLFAHLVDKSHALSEYWHRPLTFKSYGIDAISCSDEQHLTDSLEYLEYKNAFTTDVEFNHPFSITNMIVCWDFAEAKVGTSLSDSYDYVGSIKSYVESNGKSLGFLIGDIHLKSGLHAIGNEITVLSLKRLLANTFKMDTRAPQAKASAKSKSK
jgi:hypothetical protein